MARSGATTKSFTARVEPMPGRLRWIIAYVPFDVKKTWGSGGLVKVRGNINGFEFRTSLFPSRSGRHFLLVNKQMQKGAVVAPGGSAKITLTLDTEERTVTVPPELERELKQDRPLRKWFDALNYSMRREIAKWVIEPKSPESRRRRAEQMAERLYLTMDAERELPPVLRAAFDRRPRSFLGWQRLSPAQRRYQLLAIFYYRTPDSRARRIEKLLDMAEARIDRTK